jgi:hypothetical protein
VSTEVAHFQARRAWTGVGFATSESEHIISHPMRRRIALALILAGNAGLVTIIAIMVVGFAGEGDTSGVLARVGTLVGGPVVILLATRSRMMDTLPSRLIPAALRRFTRSELGTMCSCSTWQPITR